MPQNSFDMIGLVTLTIAYWLTDRAIRVRGYEKLLKWAGVGGSPWQIAIWVVACLILAIWWRWDGVDASQAVRFLAIALSAILSWNAATKDFDLVTGNRHIFERWLLVISLAGAWFSPAFLLMNAFLLTHPFGMWEHHATLPMRILQVIVAYVALSEFGGVIPVNDATLFFFVLTIQISHFFITAIAKGWLGPKWYSWMIDNRLHHLVASSYSWGWGRFVPWPIWRKGINVVKTFEKPIQCGAFVIEFLAPLALIHPSAAIGFCLAWSAFHLGVFVFSGILFWDWILTNLAIAWAIVLLPTHVSEPLFGPVSVAVSMVFMVIFPLRHKLWKPIPLGWWDTPFTQRMHWRAHGKSGTEFGIYNDFMCPHERLYGKVHACFLAPAPGITYHLGEVWKHELRDEIRKAGPDLANLEKVRARFGVQPRDETMAANHLAYLQRFFFELNRGRRKHVLPRWLRWLKAPGDQVYYWGDLPAFRGQEEITAVSLHYREEYFDGKDLRRLKDELVTMVNISADAEEISPVSEPTPKQIDELLLRFANGRLIDLPGFGDGYVTSDDGATTN